MERKKRLRIKINNNKHFYCRRCHCNHQGKIQCEGGFEEIRGNQLVCTIVVQWLVLCPHQSFQRTTREHLNFDLSKPIAPEDLTKVGQRKIVPYLLLNHNIYHTTGYNFSYLGWD